MCNIQKFVPPSSSNPKPPPKGAQYWILLLLSVAVFALYLGEIFLSRTIIKEQRFLIDQREIAEGGAYYKQGWQKLAVEVWKASPQDPALLDYLKSEGVGIHQGPPPSSEPASGTTNAAPSPAAAPQPGATTPAPATP